MKKSAQGLIEFALMLCFIAMITVSMMIFYNNQKQKFVQHSRVELRK